MFFPYYGKKAHVRAIDAHCFFLYLLQYILSTSVLCLTPFAFMSLSQLTFTGQVRAAGGCGAALAGKGRFQR